MTATEIPHLPDRRLCVAPMMAHTDRHFRYLLRLFSSRAMLYTEMLTTGALMHADAARRMAFDPAEHPVGLQLGGSDPGPLAHCARLAEDSGYDEVNLNVGCPSDRVSTGRFGACLMAEPELVATCVAAMIAAVRIPVTVKSRIGIGQTERYEDLARFVKTVADAGCRIFIIHARRAVLGRLSPKQNREVPALRHDFVHRLKRDFPELEIIVNGGIRSLVEARPHLDRVDGVMLGRAVCDNPALLATADREIFGLARRDTCPHEAYERFMEYAEMRLGRGDPLHCMARHALCVFHGRPGARAFRRYLSRNAVTPGAGIEVMHQALALVANA